MLEKQYNRVIRWVHRAQSMSDGGKYSDAIMDVECARAELEDARQELLLCHKDGFQRVSLPPFCKALPAAACAVLMMALPVGLEPSGDLTSFKTALLSESAVLENSVFQSGAKTAQNPVWPQAAEERTDAQSNRYKEWLTQDEKKLLDAVRKGMNQQKMVSRAQPPAELPTKAPGAAPSVVASRSPLAMSVQESLPAEEIFRLMEVGRKALQKKNETVVVEFN